MNAVEDLVYLGIDPGVSGAWALIDQNSEVLSAGLWDQRDALLAGLRSGMKVLACLERVGVQPHDAKNKAGVFMRNAGFWDGVIASFELASIEISPQKWQNKILDTKPPKLPPKPNETAKETRQRLSKNKKALKEYIAEFVKKRYPSSRQFITLKKHYGIADAVCLADYARRFTSI